LPTSGINFSGTNVNGTLRSTTSDGLWFAADGDGGAAADYALRWQPAGTPFNLTGSPSTSGLAASNQRRPSFKTCSVRQL